MYCCTRADRGMISFWGWNSELDKRVIQWLCYWSLYSALFSALEQIPCAVIAVACWTGVEELWTGIGPEHTLCAWRHDKIQELNNRLHFSLLFWPHLTNIFLLSLISIVRRLISVVCQLISIVHQLISVVCLLIFIVHQLISVVYQLISIVHQLIVVHQLQVDAVFHSPAL